VTLAGWLLVTLSRAKKLFGDVDGIEHGKYLFPGWPAREDDVAGLLVAADEDFLAVESELGWDADGLAASGHKDFCGLSHFAALLLVHIRVYIVPAPPT